MAKTLVFRFTALVRIFAARFHPAGIKAAKSMALRTKDLARVTVDTTVQPKNVTFPTDAKLLHAAIKGLTRLARKHGVQLRNRMCASPSARR